MDNVYAWMHDDITWCGNECSYTKCERNLANRLEQGGYFSAAMFKDTNMCPLYHSKKNTAQKKIKVKTVIKKSKGIGTAESQGIGTAVSDTKDCGIGTAVKDERKH